MGRGLFFKGKPFLLPQGAGGEARKQGRGSSGEFAIRLNGGPEKVYNKPIESEAR